MKLPLLFLQVLLSQSPFSGTNLQQNRLFQETRWRLAIWYTGILGLILAIGGLGVYKALVYAHQLTIDREIELTANKVHENLESILKQPGQWEIASTQLLPDVCLVESGCWSPHQRQIDPTATLEKSKYYMLFWSPTGDVIALAGNTPDEFHFTPQDRFWQNITAANGTRYRQFSLKLHTQDFQDWGFIQVGLSLHSFDNYLTNLRWLLLIGFPGVIFLLVMVSWYLAGRAMEPIYQSYLQIQQFSSDAAHELRTPLAAIQATVESVLMMPSFDETEAREILKTVIRQNKRISNLVSDLLMLCRLNRQLTLKHQFFVQEDCLKLQDLVVDLVEDFGVLALASEIELSSKVLVPESLQVRGDYKQLYRLVANLVSNALQYTAAGGKVTIILTRVMDYAVLHVQDNGQGISREHQDKIFARFYRIQNDRSRQTGGSGLGLSIADAIAKSHQGKLEVQSELGQGSTFTVWLPLKK